MFCFSSGEADFVIPTIQAVLEIKRRRNEREAKEKVIASVNDNMNEKSEQMRRKLFQRI